MRLNQAIIANPSSQQQQQQQMSLPVPPRVRVVWDIYIYIYKYIYMEPVHSPFRAGANPGHETMHCLRCYSCNRLGRCTTESENFLSTESRNKTQKPVCLVFRFQTRLTKA